MGPERVERERTSPGMRGTVRNRSGQVSGLSSRGKALFTEWGAVAALEAPKRSAHGDTGHEQTSLPELRAEVSWETLTGDSGFSGRCARTQTGLPEVTSGVTAGGNLGNGSVQCRRREMPQRR